MQVAAAAAMDGCYDVSRIKNFVQEKLFDGGAETRSMYSAGSAFTDMPTGRAFVEHIEVYRRVHGAMLTSESRGIYPTVLMWKNESSICVNITIWMTSNVQAINLLHFSSLMRRNQQGNCVNSLRYLRFESMVLPTRGPTLFPT